MKIRYNPKRWLRSALTYIFVFLLILDCRTIWLHLTSTPSYLKTLISLLILITSMALIFLKGRISHTAISESVLSIVSFGIYLIVYFAMRPYNADYFFGLFLTVMAILVFCIAYCDGKSYMEILEKYRNIILLIACVSLFFWTFGSVLNIIQPSGNVYTNWTSSGNTKIVTNFYNIYYNTQKQLIGSEYICRNTAIFTEAPMSSFHFSVAFLIEIFLVKNKRKWKFITLLIAIFSTFSLTGYLVILFSAIGKFYQIYKRMKNRNKRFIMPSLPILIVVVGVIFTCAVQSQLARYQSTSVSGSFSSINSLIRYIEAWGKYPIFGYGFEESVDNAVGGTALIRSTSVITIIIKGGLYYMLLYFFLFANGFKKSIASKDTGRVLFLLILLFVVAITIVSEQYITFFLLFYFSSSDNNKSKQSSYKIHMAAYHALAVENV